VLRTRSQHREALDAASRAFEKDPENRRALYELGLAQLATERFSEAAASLAKLVEVDPGHDSGEARYSLGVAYEKCGDKPSARRTLEALARTTSLPKVLFALAALQAEAGDTDEARRSLERIIDESEYVPAYHRREVRPWVRRARRALSTLPAA
jgi:tetratricopeptide (TPR) repeat protein